MLSHNWFQIFIPLLAFILNVIAQIFLSRISENIGLLKSIIYAFGTGFCVVILGEIYMGVYYSVQNSGIVSIAISNIIIYSALGYCYFHFLNLGETARRIRILRELYESEDGLSMDEILKRYNAREIVQRRAGRLIKSGQIMVKNGKYYIGTPALLIMAKIIVAMKLLFLGKESEFDVK